MELVILAIALALDLAIGEPHEYIHPVVWIGKTIAVLEKPGKKLPAAAAFIYGLIMTLLVTGLFTAAAWLLLDWLKGFNTIIYVLVGAYLLKACFSLRALRQVALKIKKMLVNKGEAEARFELRSLVSRDTSQLTRADMVSAAVESVSESSSDSFVAPLFYFVLFGVPGAIFYRAANTLDSMIAYHGEYEYLGKFAARLDDALNFIPARLAALVIILAGAVTGHGFRNGWRTAAVDHRRTESPNAGWPMAAAAGALEVRLEKKGHYALGPGRRPLTPATIDEALRLVQTTALLWAIVCFAAGGIYLACTT